MDPNLPKQYDLTLSLEGKKVPLIPYIINTCGHIFLATIKDLEGCGPNEWDKQIICTIDPSNDMKSRLILSIGDNIITLKPFIQDMIWKTLAGFISSLKKVPDNLLQLTIELKLTRV